jgi:hypothetical protein
MSALALRCLLARNTIAAAFFACALAACGGGGSSESPAASPEPNAIVLSTQTMRFASPGTGGAAQQVQVAENGYAGVFSENDTCTPQSGAPLASVSETSPGNPATYSITPLADGTCEATFTDTNGQTTKVTIAVGPSTTQSGPRE